MANRSQFELHAYAQPHHGRGPASPTRLAETDLPATPDEARRRAAQVLSIDEREQDQIWVGKGATGGLTRVEREEDAVALFRLVPRRVTPALALLPRRPGVLVNGLAALSMTIVGVRDCLVLGPGLHVCVTERIAPHVGHPTEKLLGKACPFCRLPFTPETWVVGHRCSDVIAYHHETEEHFPHVSGTDRLDCFARLKSCLVCLLPLTLHESLAWDPNEL